jgi:hypothetical protein
VLLVAAYLVADSFGLINPVGERLGQLPRGTHIAESANEMYNSTPPTSGPHRAGVAQWGVSTRTVPDEIAVHNLEHGGIVIAYNQIAPADLERLSAFVRLYPPNRAGHVEILVHPYEKIAPGTIVLTAWGWLDRLSAYDDKEIRAFIQAHLDHCCESVD